MSERVLVTTGMKCPKPLFEVHKYMKGLAGGDVVRVLADDPAFRLDIQAWCRRSGNRLVDLREENSAYVALIQKA